MSRKSEKTSSTMFVQKSTKRKIRWPETTLPPINLWNAPLLNHKDRKRTL